MLDKFKEKLNHFSKKKIVLYLVLGIVVILICGITSFSMLKNWGNDKKFDDEYKDIEVVTDDKDDNNEESTSQVEEKEGTSEESKPNVRELLEGYSKTVYADKILEEDYKLDTEHVIVGEETTSDTEVVKKYNVIVNGVTKDLVVTYSKDGNKILFKMTLNGEVVHEETLLESEEDLELATYMEEAKNEIFKPEHLTFFKGNDGKEYVVFERHSDGFRYHINGYILNSDFHKMRVNLDGVEVICFKVLNGDGKALNMDAYSEEIGYKTKRKIFSYDMNRYLTIVNGKVRYFDVKVTENCQIGNRGRAVSYELSFDNNALIAKKLSEHEIFWASEQMC